MAAKGKRARSNYTSKGIVGTNKKITKAVARDVPLVQKELNRLDAYLKGKKVYTTIPNPNPNETNKRFVRVLMSSILGDPKKRAFIIK